MFKFCCYVGELASNSTGFWLGVGCFVCNGFQIWLVIGGYLEFGVKV